MRTVFRSPLLTLLAVLALVAVSLGVPIRAGAAQTEITVWTAFPEMHQLVVELAAKYMKENPNIKITATLFPQRAQEEKVAVALPAGQAADLIELDKFELYPYYKNGFLEPLPPEMDAWVKKNWPEYSVKANTADDGKLFDFPWFNAFKMIFYNKDYFKEAGIAKVPTTVEEMIAASKKLTKYDSKGNITRAGLDYRIMGGGAGTMQKYWTQAMIPYGAKVLEKVGDKWRAGYNNDAGRQALKMYIDAIHKDKVVAFDHKHDAEGFGLGVSAMFQREAWVVGYMAKDAPKVNYGVFPMPKGTGGWGTVGNTMGLAVPKSSKVKKEAFAFAKWMMDDAQAMYSFETSGWQPFRTNIDYGSLYKKRPLLKEFIQTSNLAGHAVYDYENMPAISEIHNRMAERIMSAFKRADLKDNPQGIAKVISDMAEETNRILADNGLLAK
jgi:multiple sugar transport system substrate-binding protein